MKMWGGGSTRRPALAGKTNGAVKGPAYAVGSQEQVERLEAHMGRRILDQGV